MDVKTFADELTTRLSGRVLLSESMKDYTSFRIGGPADLLVIPDTEADVVETVRLSRLRQIPIMPMGGGTNLLVSDLGVDGVVLRICGPISAISVNGLFVTAGAGALLHSVAVAARDHALTGLEFASGIPGTIGGAVAMNAGAHGRAIGGVVHSVRAVGPDGEVVTLTGDECRFGPKMSIFQMEPLVITEVQLRLEEGDRQTIASTMIRYIDDRRKKQPLNYPSAGCMFRNPAGEGAGRYVDQAGGKGLSVGDAQVSRLHANFIVNLGNASAEDVRTLAAQVQKLVEDKVGVRLEPEVRFVGRRSTT